MSTFSSRSSLLSTGSRVSTKNKIQKVPPPKKVVIKDKIISSKFSDVEQFVPSYMKTKEKPEICSLMSMEYARIWEEEHKDYEKNVIKEKLPKKKTFKRPTFQPKRASTMIVGGGDEPSSVLKKVEAKKEKKVLKSKPKVIQK